MQASGISWRTWGTIIISFLFFAVLLLALKNVISLDDGIRHFAMAKFMAEHGLAANTGWNVFLYHGAMADLPVDPWFLYDVLLIPLTRLSPAVALKIISLIEILLISGIFLLLLRRLRTPKSAEPWYVLALFFGDFHFTHRLLLGRPFPLFTALTLAAILLIWQKKWIVLALLLLLSALLSHLFLFPLAVSLVGVVWLLLFQERRDAARSLFAWRLRRRTWNPSPPAFIGLYRVSHKYFSADSLRAGTEPRIRASVRHLWRCQIRHHGAGAHRRVSQHLLVPEKRYGKRTPNGSSSSSSSSSLAQERRTCSGSAPSISSGR